MCEIFGQELVIDAVCGNRQLPTQAIETNNVIIKMVYVNISLKIVRLQNLPPCLFISFFVQLVLTICKNSAAWSVFRRQLRCSLVCVCRFAVPSFFD